MLNHIIPLLTSYLNSDIYIYFLVYLIPFGFLASLPCLIRYIISFR